MPDRRRCGLLVAVVLIAACGKKEPPPPDTSAAVPPASAPQPSASAPAGVTLLSVMLGKAVGDDRKVAAAAEVFGQRDTVHASVDTEGTGSATLRAHWTHDQRGQRVTVAEEAVTISPRGPTTTVFRLARSDGLPPGDYRLEIVLDGQSAATRSFKVQEAGVARRKPPATAKAEPESAPTSRRLQAASGEQLHAASLVYYGRYDCELGRIMTLSKSRQHGYVDLRAGRHRATLAPLLSSTGAVRLEQVRRGPLLVVQIPSKSILFNQKAGRRLIDDCRHAQQKNEAAAAAGQQNSLGMNLPGQVSTGSPPAAQTGQR